MWAAHPHRAATPGHRHFPKWTQLIEKGIVDTRSPRLGSGPLGLSLLPQKASPSTKPGRPFACDPVSLRPGAASPDLLVCPAQAALYGAPLRPSLPESAHSLIRSTALGSGGQSFSWRHETQRCSLISSAQQRVQGRARPQALPSSPYFALCCPLPWICSVTAPQGVARVPSSAGSCLGRTSLFPGEFGKSDMSPQPKGRSSAHDGCKFPGLGLSRSLHRGSLL